MENTQYLYRVLVGRPGKKTPLGRSKSRQDDVFKWII